MTGAKLLTSLRVYQVHRDTPQHTNHVQLVIRITNDNRTSGEVDARPPNDTTQTKPFWRWARITFTGRPDLWSTCRSVLLNSSKLWEGPGTSKQRASKTRSGGY